MARLIGYHVLAVGFFLGVLPLSALAQAPRPGTPARPAAPTAQPAPASQTQRIEFKCPASGVAVEIRTEHQLIDSTSQGPDPADPTLCRWKRGFTVSENYFGRYSRATTDGLADLRTGFQDLFDGRREQFSVRTSSIAVGGGRNEYEDTWRRLPNETITVAGRTINTVPFENAQRGVHMNASGTQKLWYDPASGIWMKRQSWVPAGTRWGDDWVVNKISE